MVLRLVEAIAVYLAGTVMFIFGIGLYGLFISNAPLGLPANDDCAMKGSSLFGMFALKERPKWMKISSLAELKTKVGHVIVMILLVKMFERSKMVTIATGVDLLSYSVCIFLSSASLYILHNLHKGIFVVPFHRTRREKRKQIKMRLPGVEPGSIAWKAIILTVGLQTLDGQHGSSNIIAIFRSLAPFATRGFTGWSMVVFLELFHFSLIMR